MSIVISLSWATPTQAATFTPTTQSDLIAAINDANTNSQADLIDLGGATINLTANLPTITSEITLINGTIDGQASRRIFNIDGVGNLTLNDMTLQNGSATVGGGIRNDGTLRVINSTVSDNSADIGGGIYNANGSDATIISSTISGNTVDNTAEGGGIYNALGSTLRVSNSTVSGNASNRSGGGIYSRGTLELTNSTVSNNTAANNGGGILTIGSATMINSTISGNASGFAGGILNNGTLTLTNSIIAASVNSSGTPIDNCTGSGSIVSSNNNLDDDGSCPNSSLITPGTDYETTLADNGGITLTHALFDGSVAIDASGTGATASGQRGTAVQGAARDIGAFEHGASPTYPVVAGVEASYTETDGTVNVNITLSGAENFAGEVSVLLVDTLSGTATSGDDYDVVPLTTLMVDCSTVDCNGGTTVNFPLTINSDTLNEGDETVIFEILSTNGFAAIGTPNPFTVTIQDPPPPPTFSKGFAPDVITEGGTSTLTFTIDNTANTIDVTNLTFTDNLPAGLVVGSPANASTTCTGGTLTASDGTATITYTIGTVAAGSSCIVQVDITGSTPGTFVNISSDLTSSLGISDPASANLTVDTAPAAPTREAMTAPQISVYDPAISKLGRLVPGEVGVTGEQLEWLVTVTNNGNAAGTSVTIIDEVDSRLSINDVQAPGAGVRIDGQTVFVTYDTLAPGQTVEFSIVTTTVQGATVSNEACIANTDRCAVASPVPTVSELPSTGETPLWRDWLGIAMLLGSVAASLLMIQQRKRRA